MRDIKFRAWDTEAQQYAPITKLVMSPRTGDAAEMLGIYIIDDWTSMYSLEQFTGLHDKNGKEIYEGDIVEIVDLFGFEFTGEVVYDRFGFNLKDFVCSGFDNPDLAFSEGHDWQVIGNIHENPELLEEQ